MVSPRILFSIKLSFQRYIIFMILVTSKFWPTEWFRHYAFLPVKDFAKAKMMGLFLVTQGMFPDLCAKFQLYMIFVRVLVSFNLIPVHYNLSMVNYVFIFHLSTSCKLYIYISICIFVYMTLYIFCIDNVVLPCYLNSSKSLLSSY